MKIKALISCTVTAQLIRAFVFAEAKVRFSHDAAQILLSFFFFFLEYCGCNFFKIYKFYLTCLFEVNDSYDTH